MTTAEIRLIRAALKWHAVNVLTGRRMTPQDKMLSSASRQLLKAQPKDTWPYPKRKKQRAS